MSENSLFSIAIIVTTYNRPDALKLVLTALAHQTLLPDEVIVADDGSTAETRDLVIQLQSKLPYSLKHVWQTDNGFQAAKIRNAAVLRSAAEYLIFLDGDCVPFPDFIEKYQQLAEMGWFVSGHRILLDKRLTEKALKYALPLYRITSCQWLRYFFLRHSNRLFPLLRFNLKNRKSQSNRWQGVKSCNLALWKKDFLAINGFDESFIGWGYEDSDLVIRLIHLGILRKSGKFAVSVVHLWHEQNAREREQVNLKLLEEIKKSSRVRATIGLDSH
jgi:glycosyltransferase involved in cell wall biosynthesis